MAGRSSRRRSSRKAETATLQIEIEPIAAAGLMVLAILLGGASAGGYVGNAFLQLVSVLLICWGIVKLDWLPERRAERVPLMFAIAMAALMLIQLVPLPPALWTALPGRGDVAQGFTKLGVAPLPWMPLSLAPSRTMSGIAAMLPPVAMLVMVLRLRRETVQPVLWALFGMTVASVLIGLAQISSGPSSPLYFYANTNSDYPVGFFSNANHLATLGLVTLPLVGGVAVRARMRSDEAGRATVAWIAAPAVALLALLGILASSSVAGLLLAPVALGGGFLVFRGVLSRRAQLLMLIVGLVLVAAAIGVVLLSPSVTDFASTSVSGGGMGRPHIWHIGSKALRDVFPMGAGFGSFDAIFRQFEDAGSVMNVYANHAHSEPIELLIEAGLPGALLLLAFLGWYVWRTWVLWRSYATRDPLSCAATVAVALMLLHSLVDYPLRTSAMAVVFALSVGLMARTPRVTASIASAETGPAARHLSV